jgi:tRNA A37 threonylcarbamoyladenosine synthetase subunit TsaC/SUA5/YrdC
MAIARVLQEQVQEAVEALRAGELVAFPTETV